TSQCPPHHSHISHAIHHPRDTREQQPGSNNPPGSVPPTFLHSHPTQQENHSTSRNVTLLLPVLFCSKPVDTKYGNPGNHGKPGKNPTDIPGQPTNTPTLQKPRNRTSRLCQLMQYFKVGARGRGHEQS